MDKLDKEAKKHILDGKNECYMKFTFGNTPSDMLDVSLETHCTKLQMIMAFFCLATKFSKEDVRFIGDNFRQVINGMDVSEQNMLSVAKRYLQEQGNE